MQLECFYINVKHKQDSELFMIVVKRRGGSMTGGQRKCRSLTLQLFILRKLSLNMRLEIFCFDSLLKQGKCLRHKLHLVAQISCHVLLEAMHLAQVSSHRFILVCNWKRTNYILEKPIKNTICVELAFAHRL